MSIRKKILSISDSVNNLVLAGAKSKAVKATAKMLGRGVSTGFKTSFKIANDTLEKGETLIKNVSDSSFRNSVKTQLKDNIGKVTRNTLTDDSSYSLLKNMNGEPLKLKEVNVLKSNRNETPIAVSNKFLIADDLKRRANLGLDSMAHIVNGDSLLTLKQPLIKTGGDSLLPFGVQATGMGVAAIGAVQLAAGVPQAAKQYTTNRMGTNQDSQPVTSAPVTPAYAQNGGATGDLVFALRDLKGGFL